eukprot:COSAG05_NODE_3333_length_2145_cov_2.746334_1_plen_90_part_00
MCRAHVLEEQRASAAVLRYSGSSSQQQAQRTLRFSCSATRLRHALRPRLGLRRSLMMQIECHACGGTTNLIQGSAPHGECKTAIALLGN